MEKLKFYTKKDCPLCEEAKFLLLTLQDVFLFEIEEIDIYTDDVLLEKYQLMIPVVEKNNEVITYGNIDMEALRQTFE